MMENALVAILIAMFASSVYMYRYARDVYYNRLYGVRFRRWALLTAEKILADEAASPKARTAAKFILTFVYDISELVRASDMPMASPDSSESLEFLEDEYGRHAHDIREAFTCLAMLGVLENRTFGRSVRLVLGDVPRHASISDLKASLGRSAYVRSLQEVEARQSTDADDLVAAFSCLPTGRRIMTAITHRAMEAA